MSIRETFTQPTKASITTRIISTINQNLQQSGYDEIYQGYVLEATYAVVQKFTDLISAYQCNSDYDIVAQKMYQFKRALTLEAEKQKNNKQISAGIMSSWAPVCEFLYSTENYDNDSGFTMKYLQLELSKLSQ